jgi:TRAP-type mannitol/chloroaromatic compound transport system permease small subunit
VKLIRAFIRGVDGLNQKIGTFVSWLTSVMVLVVCYDVFTRYVMKNSFVAVQELQWHLFAIIFLIGAAFTLKENGHVRVDVFYARLTPRRRALIDLFGCLVFLIPFSLLVIGTSKQFVLMSWTMGEVSPDPGGLPARYLLKGMIPAGFVLVLLQGIVLALRSVLVLTNRPLDPPPQRNAGEEVKHG